MSDDGAVARAHFGHELRRIRMDRHVRVVRQTHAPESTAIRTLPMAGCPGAGVNGSSSSSTTQGNAQTSADTGSMRRNSASRASSPSENPARWRPRTPFSRSTARRRFNGGSMSARSAVSQR